MAKDDKVISLEERRRGGGGAGKRPRDADEGNRPTSAGEGSKAGASLGEAVPGRLIWLYCPTCRTLEYTELPMSGGRTHNICGTIVQEAPVELDLRAEHTVAQVNLERLAALASLLEGQRKRFEEYQHRLALAAGQKLEPYPVSDATMADLPVADVDAFGLLVSRFFHQPGAHFPDAPGNVTDGGPAPGDDDKD